MDVIMAIGRDTFAVFATVVVLFLSLATLFCLCADVQQTDAGYLFVQLFETMTRLYVCIEYQKAKKILGSLKQAYTLH